MLRRIFDGLTMIAGFLCFGQKSFHRTVRLDIFTAIKHCACRFGSLPTCTGLLLKATFVARLCFWAWK